MAQRLKQLGWQRVFPLEGGLSAWTDAGYPVDIEDVPPLAVLAGS